MSTIATMEEAQAHLPELVARLAGGEELIITQGQKPVAKLVREYPAGRQPRKPGNCKGLVKIVSGDDGHLKDFEKYMRCGIPSIRTRSSGPCWTTRIRKGVRSR